MKQIVFVIGNYKNGGVAMRSTNLANAFADRGYSCTLLSTAEIGEKLFFKLHENVSLVSLSDYYDENKENEIISSDFKKRNEKIKTLKKARYFSRFFRSTDMKMAEKIRGIRLSEKMRAFMLLNRDAVYITFGVSCFEKTFYAADDPGCKIIYAERNAPQVELPGDEEAKKTVLSNLSKISGAVVQTEDEASYYSDYVRNNLAVIHNPVKENLPEPFSGERRKVIVNFCRIAKQKNIPLLIEAFELLHEDYPDYTLEIYGNAVEKHEEELREGFISELKKSGSDSYIKILPPSGEIHKIIRDCEMFVSSSDFEGLSNSMVEAMAIGMPCVCTDCLGGGASEMIIDGENGLLVPMKNPEALYKAMKRFVEDKNLSRKCSENAAKVREELSIKNIVEKWIEVIEKV